VINQEIMWAILSGIQGNLPAYQAVLEDIQQRSVTVENLYILGDFIGVNPDSEMLVEFMAVVSVLVKN